jgi:hypothetical protein
MGENDGVLTNNKDKQLSSSRLLKSSGKKKIKFFFKPFLA